MPLLRTKCARERLAKDEAELVASNNFQTNCPTTFLNGGGTEDLELSLDFIMEGLSAADKFWKSLSYQQRAEVVQSVVRWAWSQESYEKWKRAKQNPTKFGLELLKTYEFYGQSTTIGGDGDKQTSKDTQFRKELQVKFGVLLQNNSTASVINGLLVKLFQFREPTASRKFMVDLLGPEIITTFEILTTTNNMWRRPLRLPSHLQIQFGVQDDKSVSEVCDSLQLLNQFLPSTQQNFLSEWKTLELKRGAKRKSSSKTLEPSPQLSESLERLRLVTEAVWKKFLEKPGGYHAFMGVLACSLHFWEGSMTAGDVARAYTEHCKPLEVLYQDNVD